MIKIKRVYEEKERDDGYRVFVDRLWPRGIKKEELSFNEWPKEICPSTEIRKSFAHSPENFREFRKLYKHELRDPVAHEKIMDLARISLTKNITLLYAAHDEYVNHANVLKEVLEREALLMEKS